MDSIQTAINNEIRKDSARWEKQEKEADRLRATALYAHDKGPKEYPTFSNMKHLWRLKKDSPELFAQKEQMDAILASLPAGYDATDTPGLFYHRGKRSYLEHSTGKLLWFDEEAKVHRDLYEGQSLPVGVMGAAASVAGDDEGASPAKNVVITDLFRVAEMLKADINHLDRPTAMLGVFGSDQADAAARGCYEKLVRRLEADRGRWSDDALCTALQGALEDVGQASMPPAALALVVGRRVAAVASAGARYYLVAQPAKGSQGPRSTISSASSSSSSSAAPDPPTENSSSSTAVPEEQRESSKSVVVPVGEASEMLSVTLLVGEAKLSDVDSQAAVSRHLLQCRPRAASIALLRASRKGGSTEPLAAACARIKAEVGSIDVPLPPEKRQKLTATSGDMVRARQILVRYAKKGVPADQLMDPVRRKAVTRSLEEAEKIMHEVLAGFDGEEGAADFARVCRSVSECPSALKGGEMSGDIGWADPAKGVTMLKEAVVPSNVVKALADRRVGEMTDLVTSTIGVHLLQRIA